MITEVAPRAALYRTRGIGTELVVLVTDSNLLVAAGELLNREIRRLDTVASRFRPDSELSALNRSSGRRVPVSADLFELLEAALWAATTTDGAVDPTVGAALVALGYDRDFSLLAGGVESGRRPRPAAGWHHIELDPGERTVFAPPGTVIDLGATAKAVASDRIAALVASSLGCGVLVSLGGDIAVAGTPPPGGFPVGVDDGASTEGETVAIHAGGLATSGISGRCWRVGGDLVHHIVDPRTGQSAATPWRVVTVAARSCLEANVAATGAIVMGFDALGWLTGLRVPARLVGTDGAVFRVGGWPTDEAVPAAVAVAP